MTVKKTKILGCDSAGKRISTQAMQILIMQAVIDGYNKIVIEGYGQHGVGVLTSMKLPHSVLIEISGPTGQRFGAAAQKDMTLYCMENASDDVAYMLIGGTVVVLKNASNGVANAAIEGMITIGGSVGARALTSTKWDPSLDPPELCVLGSVGDYFAEFNCGGVGIVCGINPQNPENILGLNPCTGMVGGKIYFRGKHDGSYSKKDVQLKSLDDDEWDWLMEHVLEHVKRLKRSDEADLLKMLFVREEWQVLVSLVNEDTGDQEQPISMAEFTKKHWNNVFPDGPLDGLPVSDDWNKVIPKILMGVFREERPVWNNQMFSPPCTGNCPVGISMLEQATLVRAEKFAEAYQRFLEKTPLPAAICGTICPRPCMTDCSRQLLDEVINRAIFGRGVSQFELPEEKQNPNPREEKVAVLGSGPAGMSLAWQLAQAGFSVTLYESDWQIGGKVFQTIPKERLPREILEAELKRFKDHPNIEIKVYAEIHEGWFKENSEDFDFIVIATGAHMPRMLSFEGSDDERVIPALNFLKESEDKFGVKGKKRVVIIGAGDVGCDVARKAQKCGVEKITLVDIQKPLASREEQEAVRNLDVEIEFKWPFKIKKLDGNGLCDDQGNCIPADVVIVAVGDIPDLSFLPEDIKIDGGFVAVDEAGRTSVDGIFAVGDITGPGLATDALAKGYFAAQAIIEGKDYNVPERPSVIDCSTMTLGHYPSVDQSAEIAIEAGRCLSCGTCRDCELCLQWCGKKAITCERDGDVFKYTVNDDKCIGCGICRDVCPCGIWFMIENADPI